MTRLRGRSRRGDRLVSKVPHGHWKTTTLIAALGLEGIRCSTVVDGAVNGDVFEAFVELVLVPELRPGDVVIMDNLSSHKRQRTRELIEGIFCLILPKIISIGLRSGLYGGKKTSLAPARSISSRVLRLL